MHGTQSILSIVSLIVLFAVFPSSALEKRSVAIDGVDLDSWNAGISCRLQYYNICTGWVWCWSGFGEGSKIGQVFDSSVCGPPGEISVLLQSIHFLCSGAPSGYGFTGTIAVYSVDANNCPVGAPIVSQPYLPAYVTFPFSTVAWGGVPIPNKFAIVVTTSDDLGISNPAQFGTDHPAAGPTGPVACGTCFPANRPIRSYSYGSVDSPICPGSLFNDGICNAELFWIADVIYIFDDISVESKSWGAIKGLYR